jgi:hypothetical protein
MQNDTLQYRLSTATHADLMQANNPAYINLYKRVELAEKRLTSTGYDNQSDLSQRVSEKEKGPQFYVYAKYLILTIC